MGAWPRMVWLPRWAPRPPGPALGSLARPPRQAGPCPPMFDQVATPVGQPTVFRERDHAHQQRGRKHERLHSAAPRGMRGFVRSQQETTSVLRIHFTTCIELIECLLLWSEHLITFLWGRGARIVRDTHAALCMMLLHSTNSVIHSQSCVFSFLASAHVSFDTDAALCMMLLHRKNSMVHTHSCVFSVLAGLLVSCDTNAAWCMMLLHSRDSMVHSILVCTYGLHYYDAVAVVRVPCVWISFSRPPTALSALTYNCSLIILVSV